jgi:GNAT superfamily N-acetyltransferase
VVTTAEPVLLKRDQRDQAGTVLARAFHTNPGFVWLLPDEASRPKKLAWFMRTGVNAGLADGEVHATAGTVEGAAVWLPPGKTTLGPLQLLRAGFIAGPLVWRPAAFMKFINVLNRMEHLHKEAMPGDHWYLMIIGVDPPRQGQGVGSALIAPGLQKADASRLPCYLETDKPEDVVFYQKHGFEVVVKEKPAKDAPDFWTMKRTARG